MKNIGFKLLMSQTLLIAGLVVSYIGNRWTFFTGLALIMVSGRFALRHDARPRNFFGRVTWVLFFLAVIGLWIGLSSFGAEKPPLTALIGVWLGISIDEYYWWQKHRSLT